VAGQAGRPGTDGLQSAPNTRLGAPARQTTGIALAVRIGRVGVR
jgi:hypothetical protein